MSSVLQQLSRSRNTISDSLSTDPIAGLYGLWQRLRSACAVVVPDPSVAAQPQGLFDLNDVLALVSAGRSLTDSPVSSLMRSVVVTRVEDVPDLSTLIEQCRQAPEQWTVVVDEHDRIVSCLTLDIALAMQAELRSASSEAALGLIQQLTQVISGAESFAAALQGVLYEICSWANWAFGEVWIPNADQTALQSGAVLCDRNSARDDFASVSRELTFLPYQGLPGRVWANQTTEWIEDVCQCSATDFLRVETARSVGLHGACGIPIASRDGIEAVLVFFAAEPRQTDRQFLNLTYSIARQLGQLMRRRRLENALYQSDRLNRTVLSAIATAIIRVDTTGRYLDILNSGRPQPFVTVPAADQHRYPSAAILSEPDAQQQRHAIAAVIEAQTPTTYERYLDQDGYQRWEQVTIEPLGATEGLVIVSDITARKLANLSRQTTETRYRAIVQGQQDLICRYQSDGRLTFANPAYCNYFQLDPEQIEGYSLRNLIPDAGWQRLVNQLDQLTPEQPTFTSEQETPMGDGRRWQLWTDYAIFDEDGQVLEYQAVGRDITAQKTIEAELQQSQLRYQGIVDDQTEMICRFWPDGKLSFANAAYRAFFDIPSDLETLSEIPLADMITQYVHPDDLSFVWDAIHSLSPKQPVVTYEHRVQMPDGTIYWQRWSDRAIYDGRGELLEIQSVGHDITDRKTAELKLKESQDMLQIFVKYTPAAVAMFDRDICYIAASDRWKQDYDLDDSPLVGRSHYDVFPEISQEWKDIHQQCLAGTVMTRDQDPFPRSDGSTDYVRWEVRPWHQATGEIGGIIMFTEVITDRIATQLALQRTAARLEVALKSGAIGIWEWDVPSNVLTWDERMFQLYGVSPDTPVTYATWSERLHPEDRDQAEQVIQRALNNADGRDRDLDMDFRIVRPDQTLRYLKASAKTQRGSDGKPIRMVGVNIDITQRRQAELEIQVRNDTLQQTNIELERATRLKDEFLASMSHELRTPLNAILGLSEGLQEGVFGELAPRQTRTIATIERSGRHLLELINDILDVSKIESGRFELHYTPVALRSLCENSLSFVRSQADHKEINLSYRIATTITAFSADERRLRQILINLLTNAVKFTPNGGHVSLVVTEETTGDRSMLAFAIQDTGIGIAEENLPKLFQVFVQIDSRLNRQHSGTGLGLTLAKRLAELHDGSISVESTLGQGSCFTVRIPYEGATVKPALLPTATMGNNTRPVLVVEDSASAAEQLLRYLDELELQVEWLDRGDDAIEQIAEVQPALILLDLQLPMVSGWEILSRLKNNSATQHIPVIVISVVDEQERANELGVAGYLVKPITRSQLQSAIARLQTVTTDPSPSATLSQTIDSAALIAPSSSISQLTSVSKPSSVTVLIAEDNQANIDTIEDYLTTKGYSLIMAYNGEEAIVLARENDPDLILMDIQMPVMDGLEAIRQIRATVSTTVPIIAMTALAMPADRDRCLAAGADDYIAKPIRLRLLTDTIEHLLSSASASRPKVIPDPSSEARSDSTESTE